MFINDLLSGHINGLEILILCQIQNIPLVLYQKALGVTLVRRILT